MGNVQTGTDTLEDIDSFEQSKLLSEALSSLRMQPQDLKGQPERPSRHLIP